MRRLRNDLPYTFRPPRAPGFFRPFGLWLNRSHHLGRKYRIARILDEGFQRLGNCVTRGTRSCWRPTIRITRIPM